MFTLKKTDRQSKARRGVLQTAHGTIQTPFFMPVGTNGTVKSMTVEGLHEIGAQIMLANTYHLYLRPGMDVMAKAGGLHGFAGWNKPMLTDSGGYQVFSLTKLRKLKEDGVEFRSHLDGSKHFFTPEKVLDIEKTIGADMIMPLDVCAPYPCSYKEAEESVELTTQWAKRSRAYFLDQKMDEQQKLFGIIQGAVYEDLRLRSAKEILDIGFDGYAIGGVSVGEPVEKMFETLDWVIPLLPENQPRYFMGIGLPDQIVKAVGEGIDMFDTVLPTRFGRHATAFTRKGRIILKNAEFISDFRPIDEQCPCKVCQQHTRSYIRHLASQGEITAFVLITYHNLFFYVTLMKEMRTAIEQDRFAEFEHNFLKEYKSELFQPSTPQ